MSTIIYGLVMYAVVFVIAAAVQLFVSVKFRILRFLPIGASACGLLFCTVLFLPRGLLPDPLFEDRYFALFLMTILLTCAVGCLAGWLVSIKLNKKERTDG